MCRSKTTSWRTTSATWKRLEMENVQKRERLEMLLKEKKQMEAAAAKKRAAAEAEAAAKAAARLKLVQQQLAKLDRLRNFLLRWERLSLKKAEQEAAARLLLQQQQQLVKMDRLRSFLLRWEGIASKVGAEGYSLALGDAARLGRTDEVARLLEKPYIDVNITKPDGEGWTALMTAASRGKTEAVSALLNHPKIKAKQTNKNGQTALMISAIYGQFEAMRALVRDEQNAGFPHDDERGYYLDMVSNDGQTACAYAEEYGSGDIVNYLVFKMIYCDSTDMTLETLYTNYKHTKTVQELIQKEKAGG